MFANQHVQLITFMPYFPIPTLLLVHLKTWEFAWADMVSHFWPPLFVTRDLSDHLNSSCFYSVLKSMGFLEPDMNNVCSLNPNISCLYSKQCKHVQPVSINLGTVLRRTHTISNVSGLRKESAISVMDFIRTNEESSWRMWLNLSLGNIKWNLHLNKNNTPQDMSPKTLYTFEKICDWVCKN